MKVDFTITSLRRGGGESVLVTIANNLASRGYEIKIITYSLPHEYELNPKIKIVKLHSGIIKNQTLRYIHELYKYYRIKNNRPDALISFMTQTSLSAILIAKLFRIHIIASEHTNHARTSTNKRLVNFTRKYIYRFANYVTILTSYDLEFYKKNKSNAVIVTNPCTFKQVSDSIIQKEKIILGIGGLHKYHIKGFDNLLKLIKPVLDKHKDWKLMLVGETKISGYDFLYQLAKDLKIENQVVFAGLRDDVQNIMSKSEIFVLSSRNEGLPMVLIEAMFQGMACVSYNCVSGPSDIIENNINGILVSDQDQTEMAFQINRLVEDKQLRDKLSRSTSKIASKFDEDLVCNKWESLIKSEL
ncbi:glycosyltransferase family 4 protein [uncultured Algibacter sp.]|uniref:glycosyltransferase family 4 protein n=1 Tax=uncultured Algibacter sp. TaxID=298659 RepID=UPI0026042C41|nr:glycosyltransferase family 4 protein [uncultured Algibacter sp.]